MTKIHENTIKLQHCEIHYLSAGPADGPVVVLLHGMKFKAETWQQLGTLEYLAGLGLKVLAVDMPGFGKSPACDQVPVEVLAEYIQALDLPTVTLIGPSMGGRIALEFTLQHGRLIDRLVLVGAVGVEENRQELHKIQQAVLILWGEQDQVSSPAMSDILLKEIVNSERIFFVNAPHPCYLDQPDKWHAELKKFLCKQ
ncbi:alpha/beta fold hydrolase [Desulfogranum japonicum]|uniref:alpha/beta fold hydrolase n=1 Tax=Desulfogranum japonicum TaxID=231447 RepID=UPI00041B049B|nr:alpha/beta hydrolase [Desulfogranum japonicum]